LPGKCFAENKILNFKASKTNFLTRNIRQESLLVCLFRIKTNATLSQLKHTYLLLNRSPHSSTSKTIGYNSFILVTLCYFNKTLGSRQHVSCLKVRHTRRSSNIATQIAIRCYYSLNGI
jgi:hypothetical protein